MAEDSKVKRVAIDPNARDKNLSVALGMIEKEFGKGAIMKLGDNSASSDVSVISTGALSLDIALGIMGVPRGRIVEIFGPESSGKTTLCMHIIANAQRAGGVAAIIDAEHAVDPVYAAKIGVNVDNLLISQPDCGEDALNIADMLVRSNAVDVLVVDSVAALVPRAEIEGQMGFVRRSPRQIDVPGSPQTYWRDQPQPHLLHLHQPDPRKNRRHVRKSRNDHRR